jgi:putative phosphoribosyl transferase
VTGLEEISIVLSDLRLPGTMSTPPESQGVVLFAHGSGSSRHSPRNRHVADTLNRGGLATLLFDLLTEEEERDRRRVFDIPLLGGRLASVAEWVLGRDATGQRQIGYFGASTGAGAALWAAAHDQRIAAIVSRGGRPDLAAERLGYVTAPTLLIVGGRDQVVERLNRDAQRLMTCETRLEIVPGATHLFEEPGALDQVASLARDWFVEHMRG